MDTEYALNCSQTMGQAAPSSQSRSRAGQGGIQSQNITISAYFNDEKAQDVTSENQEYREKLEPCPQIHVFIPQELNELSEEPQIGN